MGYLSEKHHRDPDGVLAKHYLSYRESVLRDILPGFEQLITHLSCGTSKGSMPAQEWLEILGLNIYDAVEAASIERYLAAITEHKRAFMGLLADYVKSLEPDINTREDFVLSEWRVFRFSGAKSVRITFEEDFPAKTILVVPHYNGVDNAIWSEGPPVFDADEILLLTGLPWEDQKTFLNRKVGLAKVKILSAEAESAIIPLGKVNSPFGVRDWKLIGCRYEN
jgi:hypothetical protein